MIDVENRTKINVGCGKRNFGKDWIHVDGESFSHIEDSSIFPLALPDQSMDLVYASHVLEYFDSEEAVDVVKDWVRVLKSNGILRLAVPNFDIITWLATNMTHCYSIENFLGPLYGKMQMKDKTIYHKTCYNNTSLYNLLTKCELTDIFLWDWGMTEHSQFDDHSQAYLPHMDKTNGVLISLNMQGMKI